MPRGKKVTAEEAAEVEAVEVLREPTGPAAAAPKVVHNNFDKLRTLTGNLNKHYKSENLVRSGAKIRPVYKVPFAEPVLDYVTDGGIPISRVTELLGVEHSGKTRNAIKAMKQFQHYCFNCHTPASLEAKWLKEADKKKADKDFPVLGSITCTNCDNPRTCIQAFVDYEGTADKKFLSTLGVDVNGILYSQPKIPSEVVSIVDGLLRNPGVGLIVIDSVGSMSSDSEVDKAMEDIHMNQNALFLNRAMRKWQAAMNGGVSEDLESPTTLLVINQSYQTLGTYSVDVAQGGRGLRHGKGLSLKTRIKEKVYNNTSRDAVLGVHVAVENLKNKTGMPYRKAEYYLNLNDNDPELGYCEVDMANQILDLGLELGLVTQRGAWTFYTTTDGVEMKWNGKAAMLKDLRDMPDVQQTVLKGIYATLRPEEESE